MLWLPGGLPGKVMTDVSPAGIVTTLGFGVSVIVEPDGPAMMVVTTC